MNIERIERPTVHVFYRIFSEYAKDSLAMEPTELLDLLSNLEEMQEILKKDAGTVEEPAMVKCPLKPVIN